MSPFPDRFQHLFQTIFWQASRRLARESSRLSPQTIAVLRLIDDHGPLTAAELSAGMGRAASTVSETLARLTGNGLITRIADTRDRRRQLIWLTDAGRTALTASQTPLDPAMLAAMAAGLTAAERQTLITLLEKMIKEKP